MKELEPTQLLTEYDILQEVIPSTGWLGKYVSFMTDLEACIRFKFFSACCVLGSTINNKVWIYRGSEDLLPKLFPNIWVILLAPPGRGHKTSTINTALNCLYKACPEVRILADKLTPESLVKALSEPESSLEKIRIGVRDATGIIKAPELSVFFGKAQYNQGLISLITDLYDFREEWSVETIMRGRNTLKNICISILGGSTPDWLQKMLPDDAFTGGFMSRFVLVEMPVNYFKRRAFPKKTVKQGWDELVQELREKQGLSGEMSWTQDSADYYEKYYENLKPTGDVQKDAYQEREAEQILRLTMLLALSENRMYISLEDFKLSQKIFNTLMIETDPRIERLTTNPRMSLVQDIQDLLRVYGNMKEDELMRKVYRGLSLGENQFYEALRVLKIAKVIENIGQPGHPMWKMK
jgi:hypothetical protein